MATIESVEFTETEEENMEKGLNKGLIIGGIAAAFAAIGGGIAFAVKKACDREIIYVDSPECADDEVEESTDE